MTIPYDTFAAVDIRAGTVVAVQEFPEARKAAYKLYIDFGELGLLWSSAQVTEQYAPDDLVGRQVAAVVNLGEKRIAGFVSQCLVLGFDSADGGVVVIGPERAVPNGARLY